jgi:hypothetical protein
VIIESSFSLRIFWANGDGHGSPASARVTWNAYPQLSVARTGSPHTMASIRALPVFS